MRTDLSKLNQYINTACALDSYEAPKASGFFLTLAQPFKLLLKTERTDITEKGTMGRTTQGTLQHPTQLWRTRGYDGQVVSSPATTVFQKVHVIEGRRCIFLMLGPLGMTYTKSPAGLPARPLGTKRTKGG